MIFYYGLPHPEPCGGMMVQLRHVVALQQAGIPATFVVEAGYSPKWIDLQNYPVTYTNIDQIGFSSDDVLVIPEHVPYAGHDIMVKKVILIQNWAQVAQATDVFYTDKHVRGLKQGDSYSQLGFAFALTSSPTLAQLLTMIFDLIDIPVLTVTDFVEIPDVEHGPIQETQTLIPLLHSQGFQIFDELLRLYSRLWRFQCRIRTLPSVSRPAFIRALHEADIYVHLKYPEGMPLRPLEAMRAKAVVVGFAGGGGLEYMKHEETALVAEDGNFFDIVTLLCKAIQNKSLREKLRAQAHAKSLEYTYERFRDELLSAFSVILRETSK